VSITVYGASDDLIEVDGDITEEFAYTGDEDDYEQGNLLAFSDGTVLRIAHADPGIWRITPVAIGTGRPTIVQAPEDDDANRTDQATFGDDCVTWVVRGDAIAKRGGR
jgi:hypothetical protein